MIKFIKIAVLLVFVILLVAGIIMGDLYSNGIESSTLWLECIGVGWTSSLAIEQKESDESQV